MCPSCGVSFTQDTPIELDGFLIDPRARLVVFNGLEVEGLRKSYLHLLYSIAKGYPNYVTREALLNRVTDGECDESMKVNISNLRKILREHGIASPFITVHGLGYKWGNPAFYDQKGA